MSRADRRPFGHALLVGGPGLGKTLTASIIATLIGTQCHTSHGNELGSLTGFEEFLKPAADFLVVHLDEAHRLRKDIQTQLYKLMDASKLTFLLSTTDPQKLLKPLRERFPLYLSFEYYTEESLDDLLSKQCEEEGWQFEADLCKSIATISRGTPRTAIRFLHDAQRVTRGREGNGLTCDDFQKALEMADYDEEGLCKRERQYLEIVRGGRDTLSCISAVMGLGTYTISETIEPDLMRLGFLKIGRNSKRILCNASSASVAELNQQVVPTQSTAEHRLRERVLTWFRSNPECQTLNSLMHALEYSNKELLSRVLKSLVEAGELEWVPKGAIRPSNRNGTQRHDGYRLRSRPTSLTSSEPDVTLVVTSSMPQAEATEALSNTDQPERQSAIAGSTEPGISQSEIGAEATENDSTSTSPQS